MARESQGLQLALIIFAAITVVLSVTTYIYWKKTEDLARQRRQADEERLATAAQFQSLGAENADLKRLLGYAEEARLAEIAANFDPEMALFANTYQGSKNYRSLAPFLVDEVVKSKAQMADAQARGETLTALVTQVRTEETGLTQQARKAAQASHAELARRLEEFRAERERVTADQTALAAKLDASARAAADRDAAAQVKLVESGRRIKMLEQLIEKLQDEIKELRGTSVSERADGRVTLVDQGPRIVRLNLGEADALRRLMVFTVVDRDAGRVAGAKSKGRVEVTKILGPHEAEARILQDDLRDPILADDQVFTPAWTPGQKLRFALVGLLDLDGDGRSDRAKLKSLIAMYGGEVSAEGTDEGRQIGKLDIDTRYLIVGERPTDRTRPELIEVYSRMTTEARQLAIEQLSLARLLTLIGHREPSRTTQLGPAR